MRHSIPCLLAVLVLDCGGRVAVDEPASPTEFPTASPGRLATYGPAGVGIALYPADLSATSQPITTLEGSWHTDACEALAFDSERNVYALCYQAVPSEPPSQVNVFAATAEAGDAPMRVISGPETTIGRSPTDVAVDTAGYVYVVQDGYCQLSSDCYGMVSVFAPGVTGNVAPARVIQGPHTELSYSAAIAVDAAGRIYVGNAEGGPILVFAADATGDAQPIRRVGRIAEIGDVTRIAIDSEGTLYVTDVATTNGVLVYGASATEGDPPERVIAGPATGLDTALGIAVDRAGRILVSQRNGLQKPGTISIFAADAAGNVAPQDVLANVSGDGIALAP